MSSSVACAPRAAWWSWVAPRGRRRRRRCARRCPSSSPCSTLATAKDELNVKALEIRDRAEGLVREIVKPDLKVLGPKLGKDLPKIRAALAEGRYERRDGARVVEGLELQPNEV